KYVDEVVYKKEKDPKKAAGLFLEFVKEFPKSDNADRALTYAMLIAREANELDKAAEYGERLLREYPTTVFDLKVKYALAKLYEQMANFEKSASMYDEFVQTYDLAAGEKAIGYANIKDLLKKEKEQREKDAKANKGKPAGVVVTTVDLKTLKDEAKKKEREALIAECTDKKDNWVQNAVFNQGFWFEGVGKFDRAIAAYNRYIVRFKDEKDAPDIAYNIGLVLEKSGQSTDALKHFDSYLATYAKDARVTDGRRYDIKYRQFLLNQKLKNVAEVDRLAKDLAAGYAKLKDDEKKNDRAMLAAAHAKFHLMEPQWKAYVDMKFKKIGTFKTDLPAKQKRQAELEKSYIEVLAIGNPEYGIAALTRIGLAYADFAANIVEIPDPPGLDEDQLSMFRGELESRYVFPVEEKSMEALEKAVAKSSELTMYNEWTLVAQDRLNKYKPGLYGKARDVAYRGSEFFVTAGFEKSTDLPSEATVEKPKPPAEKKEVAAPAPGAGSR
ncbi:MAG: tetratricopeptide repeat protein, partial [Archangium sp.]|nr:tetratricopeptide repeat protein [Archangium sp.]